MRSTDGRIAVCWCVDPISGRALASSGLSVESSGRRLYCGVGGRELHSTAQPIGACVGLCVRLICLFVGLCSTDRCLSVNRSVFVSVSVSTDVCVLVCVSPSRCIGSTSTPLSARWAHSVCVRSLAQSMSDCLRPLQTLRRRQILHSRRLFRLQGERHHSLFPG